MVCCLQPVLAVSSLFQTALLLCARIPLEVVTACNLPPASSRPARCCCSSSNVRFVTALTSFLGPRHGVSGNDVCDLRSPLNLTSVTCWFHSFLLPRLSALQHPRGRGASVSMSRPARSKPYERCPKPKGQEPASTLKHCEMFCGRGRVTSEWLAAGHSAAGLDILRDGVDVCTSDGFKHYQQQARVSNDIVFSLQHVQVTFLRPKSYLWLAPPCGSWVPWEPKGGKRFCSCWISIR